MWLLIAITDLGNVNFDNKFVGNLLLLEFANNQLLSCG